MTSQTSFEERSLAFTREYAKVSKVSQKLFREKALVKLSSPEDLDKLMRVTDLRGWVALMGLAGLIMAALVWGIFGIIPTLTQGQGVLIRQAGIQEIKASAAGELTELNLQAGDAVKANQLIGKFKDEAGTETELRSPFTGTVLEVLVEKGTFLKPQVTMARLELTGQPLQAVIFVPLAEGKRLRPGLKAQLSLSSVPPEEHGYLLGTVSKISPFPVSSENLLLTLKNRELVQALLNSGPVLMVEINLEADPTSFSGFKWSSQNGPHTLLSSGTLCQANLVLGQQRPISLVLPVLKEQEG